MDWMLRETGFHPERNDDNGNRFLVGNGYMGVRGTLEEFTKEQLVAVNLSGIFDKVGDGWREPLNAPNALYVSLEVEGETYHVMEKGPAEHELLLHYREGVLYRRTVWDTEKGRVLLETERFADMDDPHCLYMRYRVTVDYDCDMCVTTGVDGDVWDIYGPHYQEFVMTQEEGDLCAEASIQEKRETVWVREELWKRIGRGQVISKSRASENVVNADRSIVDAAAENVVTENVVAEEDVVTAEDVIVEDRKIYRKISCQLKAGQSFEMVKRITVYTGKDVYERQSGGFDIRVFEEKKRKHIAHWEEHWQRAAVLIEGDDEAMAALNYSVYHLHSIAPRHSKSLSVPARGLSGQTYKGAVFWDSEMFMLPFFLYTDPEVARSLLRYRIDTLPGAMRKAEEYGLEGAFYAWESQEGGFDGCSDYNVTDVFTGRPMRTYFRDKQIHISSAIVYGLMRYVEVSGDEGIWAEGGLETVLECARFYYGLLVKRVADDRYELWDVIGPDEYHERVNNNGYTNRMAKYTFEAACGLLDELVRSDAVVMLKRSDVDMPEQSDAVGVSKQFGGSDMGQSGASGVFDRETVKRIREKYDVEKLRADFSEAAGRLYLPVPGTDGVIEQFDGYFKLEDVSVDMVRSRLLHEKEYWGGAYGVASETRVIKQADVVTWLTLFAEEFSLEILKNNWDYYEPYTEHGSSLSACMYAWLACLCGMPERAYPFFMKSAMADWKGGGKQWAGLVYIGGSHPAAAGGAYITAINGFAGVSMRRSDEPAEVSVKESDEPAGVSVKESNELAGGSAHLPFRIEPRFPSHWTGMKFVLNVQDILYDIEIKKENGDYSVRTLSR